ncbi:hypothetical protein Tco_0182454, partial [Tanacetum coccineum]
YEVQTDMSVRGTVQVAAGPIRA